MRKSLQIRPLSSEKLQEITPEASPAQSRNPSPATIRTKPTLSPTRTASVSPMRPRSVLELILPPKKAPQHSKNRRIESESATGALEDSSEFDPKEIKTPAKSASKSNLGPPMGRKSTAGSGSQDRTQARSITHTRMSSVDSIEPLNSEMMGKMQDWNPDVTQNSEVTSDRFKLSTSRRPLRGAETPRPEFAKEKREMYNIERVAESTRARNELMAQLNPASAVQNAVVALAQSTPSHYPSLDLSEKGLKDTDISNILRLLQVYPFATALDLFGNQITLNACEDVVFSSYFPSIIRVAVSHNPLSPLGPSTAIGQFLQSFPNLQMLEMADCGLTDEDLFRVAAYLVSLQYLRVLVLRGNKISDGGVVTLMPVLEKCVGLEKVDLRNTLTTRKVSQVLGAHKSKLLLSHSRKCCEKCRLF